MEQFVVTIARCCGSDGGEIGKALANELGINCYDRKLLRLASDRSGIHESFFGLADEDEAHPLLYKAAQRAFESEPKPPHGKNISDKDLFTFQAKLICELAERESCVIIGRCADYVLKNQKNVIKLFIYAPLNVCIARLAERNGLTMQEAKNEAETTDKRRTAYYKHYTGSNWRDVTNYDLCFNSGSLGISESVAFLKEYIRIWLESKA
ncbi:MAG: cytidylate kinase-like family protein [Christensenellales bacterium]